MPEIIGTFLRTEQWDERANCSIEAWDSSRRNLAQECLEFAVRHFDRIEIGRVFRQVAKGRPCFFDRLPNAGPQMDPAVVHHNYVIAESYRFKSNGNRFSAADAGDTTSLVPSLDVPGPEERLPGCDHVREDRGRVSWLGLDGRPVFYVALGSEDIDRK